MADFKEDKFRALAYRIKNGDIGEYVYHLEQDTIYIYQEGYWKPIKDLQFLDKIENGLLDEHKNKIVTRYPIERREKIIKNFKVLKYKLVDEFNNYPLINFINVMFDPIAMNLLKHEAKYFSTIRIPYKYDALAKCELWLRTLGEIFEGDKNKTNALQEFIGYCLSADNNQKKGLLLLGETDTGKSTIIDITRELLGEVNCSNVPLQYLSNPQWTPLLMNKIVNIDPEVNKEAVNYEREFKLLTGGKDERVSCNQKHIPTFEFIPRCKLILSANIFPRITDHSSAFYQRLLLIPCNRRFMEHEQDKKIAEKLRIELPGIFNWAVEGMHKLIKRGRFDKYEFIADAVEELEEENNPAYLFFKEHIVTDVSDGIYTEKAFLFDKYKDWCKKNEQYTLTHIQFSRCLMKKYGKFTPKQSRLTEGLRAYVWRNMKYMENKELEPIKQEISWKPAVAIDKTPSPTTIGADSQQDINWGE